MNNTSLHWTEDPTLLEQFVLGRIPSDRRVVLLEHLETCAQCRDAVAKEQEFVTSVRAYGRDQLRARLKENLKRTPSGTVPWPHVLSAAAVVVVIVGLGIYNRWWMRSDIRPEDQIAVGKTEQTPPAPGPAEERGEARARERAEQPSAGVAGQLAEDAAGGQGEKKEKQFDMVLKDDKGVEPSFAEQPVQALDADARKGREGEVWVDGIITGLSAAESNMRKGATQEAAAPSAQKEVLGKASVTAQQGKYFLQQMPGTALPVAQQRQKKGPGTVPTRVEPTRDGAILTAYSDQIDLRDKTVQGEFAGVDSLVFVVDGVRIVYRISALPAKH